MKKLISIIGLVLSASNILPAVASSPTVLKSDQAPVKIFLGLPWNNTPSFVWCGPITFRCDCLVGHAAPAPSGGSTNLVANTFDDQILSSQGLAKCQKEVTYQTVGVECISPLSPLGSRPDEYVLLSQGESRTIGDTSFSCEQ